MIPFATQGSSGLLVVVLGLYVLAGAGTALLLARRDHPPATALAALAAWPFLLPLLSTPPHPPGRGPFAQRIDGVFRALEGTLGDPAAGEVPWSGDLEGLRGTLHRGDARLALVEGLLADHGTEEGAVGESVARLRAARDRATAEIEAVLAEVVQLRLQVGLVALAGQTVPVQERLRELLLRARALDEIARLEPAVRDCEEESLP